MAMSYKIDPKNPHYQEGRRMVLQMKFDHMLAEARTAAEMRKRVHAGESPLKKRNFVGRGKPRGRRGGRRKASATETAESTLSSHVEVPLTVPSAPLNPQEEFAPDTIRDLNCLSSVMPGGSTQKKCPFCQGILFCAQKICSHCKKQQPLKQRLKKKLRSFDEKREDWVMKRKNNHNIASIKDEAIFMLEKLHAIGYKPVLFLGKKTKKGEIKCQTLIPRCRLTANAKEGLQKMGSFYEYLCEGWNLDSVGSEDEVTMNNEQEQFVTPHLTPCDPPEDASNQDKSTTTQAQEVRNEPVGDVRTSRVEEEARTSRAEEEEEEARTFRAEEEEEEARTFRAKEEEEEARTSADVNTGSTKRRGFVGSHKKKKRVSKALRSRPVKKRPKIKCSYHSGLETFPIRSVKEERVRKGKAEILVDWEPCPVCGEEWDPSWEPKDSVQINI